MRYIEIYYLLLEITITLLQSGFSPSSEPRSQALLRQQLRTLIEVALNPCPELLDLRLGGGEDLPTAKILAESSGFRTTAPVSHRSSTITKIARLICLFIDFNGSRKCCCGPFDNISHLRL